ncbi:MAG: ACP S-malonyltransferase [Candidatus Protochlamydia sp.]|nr:ACP S-malonyltransferase [Candidatus Protochlamydia sp.]
MQKLKHYQKVAFLFPGQGAQYPAMGKDFIQNFSAARLTFEEADDCLSRPLSSIILDDPEQQLTQTVNSQPAIYTVSMAILRVFKELYEWTPFACAGLSLGEYTALSAGEWLSFRNTLPLVQHRANCMQAACEFVKGSMAAVIGLSNESIEDLVKGLNLPNDLWIANYNCPGQVVLSGSIKGIEAGMEEARRRGAKRVLPLQVSGAFHSGLMKTAEDGLSPNIMEARLQQGDARLVMNVPGDFVSDLTMVRSNLIRQVTHSVRWEQGIKALEKEGVDLFIEFGPGRSLSGMNKKIGVNAPTLTIEKVEDLDQFGSIK